MPGDDERRVPAFQSEAEEIEFWETHDVEDYLTGEEEPLERILAPEPGELENELIVSVKLAATPATDYWPALTLHFAAAALGDEADRDFSVLFEREVIPQPFDGYATEYRRAKMNCGASAGPIRQLRIDLFVTSRREAEEIGSLLRSSTAGGHEPYGTGLSQRTQAVVPRIANWLVQRKAREITAEQVDEFLRL